MRTKEILISHDHQAVVDLSKDLNAMAKKSQRYNEVWKALRDSK